MLKLLTLVAAVTFTLASVWPSAAAPRGTPGHTMQQRGSVPGHPGASGYAPGHVKKAWNVRSARDFAPGAPPSCLGSVIIGATRITAPTIATTSIIADITAL